MKAGKFAILLVSVLFGLSEALIIPEHRPLDRDLVQLDSRSAQSIEAVGLEPLEHHEARGRSRGGAGRTRPSRTRPAKKKAKAKQAKKTKAKKAKKTNKAKKAKSCQLTSKSKKGKNGKLVARVEEDPCRKQDENDQIMIHNYKIAAKAAAFRRPFGKKLHVNKLYLFLMKQGPTMGPNHHAVVLGKVMKVGDELGMEATVQQLVKPSDKAGNVVRHPNAKYFCNAVVGGVCATGPYRRVDCGKFEARYKLVGTAGLEFADPEHFIQKGNDVLMTAKPYNIITNSCHTFAKDLINVAKLGKGQTVTLTDEQARPSEPLLDWPDADSDFSFGNLQAPEGGFRVIEEDGGFF